MLSLLRNSATTDKQLIKLAERMHIPNLRVAWLHDYDKKYNGPQVLNLGNQFNGGTHWVAVYKDHYFDALGLPPPPISDLPTKQYTDIDIQPSDQGHCGQYCLLFLRYAIDNDLGDFYSLFNGLNIT
jgi:hypothetical protein